MANWRKLLDDERYDTKDFSPLVGTAPEDLDWNREFNSGFGRSEGEHFTAWTEDRVYFPVVYDGAEWVASVPRNPCAEITNHVGGE